MKLNKVLDGERVPFGLYGPRHSLSYDGIFKLIRSSSSLRIREDYYQIPKTTHLWEGLHYGNHIENIQSSSSPDDLHTIFTQSTHKDIDMTLIKEYGSAFVEGTLFFGFIKKFGNKRWFFYEDSLTDKFALFVRHERMSPKETAFYREHHER